MPSDHIRNPQTEAFLQMLQLPYNLDHGRKQQPSAGGGAFDLQQQRLLSGGQSSGPPGGVGGGSALPPPPARPVTDAQVGASVERSG